MTTIRCVIIDDDELARDLLETYVEKIDYLEGKGSFENPLEALSYIKANPVDLLFLDIQMPDIKGTDFAELLATARPKIVFTTAYSEYAIKGFELSALDYLLKPITFQRFLSAVEKFPRQESGSEDRTGPVVVKSGYELYRVPPDEIVYIESDSEYVRYHLTNGKKIISHQSLSKLLPALPGSFLRVHRSYIVNGKKVSGLKGRELLIRDQAIPISDSYFEQVKSELF